MTFYVFNFHTAFFQLAHDSVHSLIWTIDASGLIDHPDRQSFSFTAGRDFETKWEFFFVPGQTIHELALGVQLLHYDRTEPPFADIYLSVVDTDAMWKSGNGIV